MDFTTNDECGLLVEGHERPPIILCPWHHPYYQRLFEQDIGMAKAMDLYMWSLHVDRPREGPPGDLGSGRQARVRARDRLPQLPQEGPAARR